MGLITGTIVSIISVYVAIKSIEIAIKAYSKIKTKLYNRHQWGKFNENGKRY